MRVMDKDENLSAFTGGVTLRDYFATHATEDDIRCALNESPSSVVCTSYMRAAARYYHADKMLLVRAK